jgi:hypothetical protein
MNVACLYTETLSNPFDTAQSSRLLTDCTKALLLQHDNWGCIIK